ncbi:hypothetical protein GCM10009114_04270 [Aliiglaciecola litoralis]|uniref:Uncharacterized protein n=1 Tax=Aliiglaciecola litoralis TaxID=582857 RepID=A0ABP3WM99_9ALTE
MQSLQHDWRNAERQNIYFDDPQFPKREIVSVSFDKLALTNIHYKFVQAAAMLRKQKTSPK